MPSSKNLAVPWASPPQVEVIKLRHNLIAELHIKPPQPLPPWAQQPRNPYSPRGN